MLEISPKFISKFKKIFLYSPLLLVFALYSCGSNTSPTDTSNVVIPGVQGPNVTIVDNNVVISMVFDQITLDLGARVPIPKYTNSFVEISPHLTSGGTLLEAIISISDILNEELSKEDPHTLPGGRPLPGIAGGTLPAVAFNVKSFNDMTFYLGENVFGSFYPVDTGLKNNIGTYRFYIQGQRAGNISLVGTDENDENGGILLMLDLSNIVKQKLREYNDNWLRTHGQ